MSNSSLKVLRSARSKAADGDKGSTGSFVTSNSLMWTTAIGQVLPLGISAHKRPFAEPISPKQSSTKKDQKVGTVGSWAAVADDRPEIMSN